MATLASLLLRLAVDRSMYTSGLRAGRQDADDFAVGVTRSMNQAANAAQVAGARIAEAQAVINGAGRGPGGRFVSPGTILAADAQAGVAAANNMAQAVAGTSTAVSALNTHLQTTKFILASFAVLGFIEFIMGSAKAATNFQSEMLLLRTQARATLGEVRNMTAALMEMAPAARTGPEELARGLYHIESVGLRGARALEVLTAAAQGARVGNADLEDVTNALIASVTSGIKGIDNMSRAMGVLDGIVGSGNMRMQDLAKSLSSGVLATAKAFGLSIQDVGAALAAMTDQGIPAQEAATRLRITIALIGAPTEKAARELSRIGLTSRDLADQMRGPDGLIGALRMLSDHLNRSGLDATEQAQLLKAAFGGSRSSSGLLTLIGSLDLLDLKMRTIKAAEKDFGTVAALQAETAAGKFQRFQAIVSVLAINLGNSLLPILTMVAAALGILASHTEIAVPILMAFLGVLTLIVGRALLGFITGLASSAVAIVVQTGATLGLTAATVSLAIAQTSAALASRGLFAAATPLLLLFGGALLPITAIVVAIALLVLNFDRVAQGVRVLAYFFVLGVKAIVDAATHLPFVGDAFKGLSEGLGKVLDDMVRDMGAAEAAIRAKSGEIDGVASNIDPATQIANQIASGADDVQDATKNLVELFGTSIQGVVKAAGSAGGDAMMEMANGIRDAQNAPLDALTKLHDMVRNQLTPTAEIARLIGMMTSEDLAAGLASGDPAVYAAALATQKLITERLDELTEGAYSAGQNLTNGVAKGLSDATALGNVANALEQLGMPIAMWLDSIGGNNAATGILERVVTSISDAAKASETQANLWNTKYKPSADAVAKSLKDVNTQLNATASSQGMAQLNSAFSDIERSAHRFFDAVHQGNLKAIDSAIRHRNALLDVKAALNMAPVDAAQKALDFRRQAIEEWRLKKAVSEASTPEQYRDAVLALQDFLAQKHVNEMRAQAESANEKINAQKDANNIAGDAQKVAEDARYARQVESFDRQLELLRRYLEKHPGEWASTNDKVLALLKSYGITYKTAGSRLGGYFVEGLREQVAAAKEAAKALGSVIPGYYPAGSYGKSGIVGWDIDMMHPSKSPAHLADGSWRILSDNMLALLHKDEMVVPPQAAGAFREFGAKPIAMSANMPELRASGGSPQVASALSSSGRQGGGTLIFQIGDERLAELTDESLYIQDSIYSHRRRISVGSQR